MYSFLHSQWPLFLIFFAIIVVTLGLADFLLNRMGVHPNTTRRTVHIMVGLLVSLAPFLFTDSAPVLLLAGIFIIVNYVSINSAALKGIHGTERITYGTVYFPVSFTILVLWFWMKDPAILLTAMLIMTLGDPIASWVGESRKNPRSYRVWSDSKSLQGSAAMFITSYVVAAVGMEIFRTLFQDPLPLENILIYSLFVAAFATMSETVSHQGTDNLTVPLGAGLMLDFMYHSDLVMVHQLMLWMAITTLIAWLAYRFKTLSLSGSVGAWLLGTIVFGIGGIEWMIPMVAFFVLSSLFSKAGRKHKQILKTVFEKGSNRDFFQVYANGGIAGVATILYYFTGNSMWYVAFLGSLAAATADTWGTELGTFSRTEPRSILNFNKVPMGTSGGMSLIGTMGAVSGSFVIAALGVWAFNVNNGYMGYSLVGWVTLAGFAGALIDSLLGATIQAQYRCPYCHKVTEKTAHCGEVNIPLVHGYRWINNDVVNLSNTISGGIIALVINQILNL